MLKRRKKQKQAEKQQEQDQQDQQEYNEIRQYQKIINKIWTQLETDRLYQCLADSALQSAETIVECAITTILNIAKPRF